jgi:hypothetical protein
MLRRIKVYIAPEKDYPFTLRTGLRRLGAEETLTKAAGI